MPRIKVKLQTPDCAPEKTHKWDAGWDLKALKETVLKAGEVTKVHTGVKMEIPAHYCGMIVPRSSMGVKHRITLANDIGIIDTEYRGEIMVFLHNASTEDYTVKQGDRFAQIVITAVNNSSLWIVDRLSNTERDDGGFGSTTEIKVDETAIAGNPLDTATAVEPVAQVQSVINNPNNDGTAVFVDKTPVQIKEPVVDKKAIAEMKRNEAIAELKKMKPAEYSKLKASGMLFEKYPIATGDMKQDLGI